MCAHCSCSFYYGAKTAGLTQSPQLNCGGKLSPTTKVYSHICDKDLFVFNDHRCYNANRYMDDESRQNHIVYMVLQSFKQCQWAHNKMNEMLRRIAQTHTHSLMHQSGGSGYFIHKRQPDAHLTCTNMRTEFSEGEAHFKRYQKRVCALNLIPEDLTEHTHTHTHIVAQKSVKSMRNWFSVSRVNAQAYSHFNHAYDKIGHAKNVTRNWFCNLGYNT